MRTLVSAGLLTALAFAGSVAHAAECEVKTVGGEERVVCDAISQNGRALRLSFRGNRVTGTTDTALMCAEPSGKLDEAKLWMPEHNHGSGPTALAPRADGCTDVHDIEFVMHGSWQVIVRYNDGDRGTFDVPVVD